MLANSYVLFTILHTVTCVDGDSDSSFQYFDVVASMMGKPSGHYKPAPAIPEGSLLGDLDQLRVTPVKKAC